MCHKSLWNSNFENSHMDPYLRVYLPNFRAPDFSVSALRKRLWPYGRIQFPEGTTYHFLGKNCCHQGMNLVFMFFQVMFLVNARWVWMPTDNMKVTRLFLESLHDRPDLRAYCRYRPSRCKNFVAMKGCYLECSDIGILDSC